MRYAYIRVSSREQNLDRQIEAVKGYAPDISEDEIFADKKSGKNFEREKYQELKSVVCSGDEVIIKELDRLGRNKEGVKDELKWFKQQGVTVRVLDLPTTLIDIKGQEWVSDMINNILIEVIAAMAEQEREKIKKRREEGIACAKAKGVKFGRPAKEISYVLMEGETVSAACRRLGVSRTHWYRKMGETKERQAV